MGRSIKPYVNPRTSRLEKWREEITTMRSLQWPNDHIAQWLLTEKKIKVSGEAVRKFCKVRHIQKGQPHRPPLPTKSSHTFSRPSFKKKKLFEYDDSQPIKIKH